MALVLKVKYQDVLRRWVASEALNTDSFPVTFGQLEAKIKELFHLSPSASLAITYVDKDNDVVMLADDQDLIDACIVQRLNPLRLDVQVLGVNPSSSEGAHGLARSSDPVNNSENVNIEAFLHALFPQATADAVAGFLQTYIPFVDSKLPAAVCFAKAEKAFKEFLYGVPAHHQAHPKLSERFAPRHPIMHPRAAISSPRHGIPALHWGIECDGCGMAPIEGTRYKSMKKTDYDLCASCLKKIGNESDYEKFDQSVHQPPPRGHYRPPCLRRGPRPFPAPPGFRAAFARGPYGWRPNHPFEGHQASGSVASNEHKKLDARFVKDVTIFDGTELAPGSQFTKIWRMSNIGTLPWPQSTQLVHIGGDRLCAEEIVTLELPEGGLPCGEEVEVCVDLTAPLKAGRYVSHWRLTAPSGQKFGHRVWVVIHVVPEGEHSPQFQASLQNGKGIVLPNDEVMGVDLNDANTVMVDVDLNGASTVVVDVMFDEEMAAIEQLAVARKGPHPHDEDGHPSIAHPDPFAHGSRDVDMLKLESVEVGGVVDDETTIIEELIAEKSTPHDHQTVHPSVVHPDLFDHGSKDVHVPIQKAVEVGAVVDDASAAFEQLAVGNSAPYYDHPSVVHPDPFDHVSKDVGTSMQKIVEVGAVVDDASAAFEQLAVGDSAPHYDHENVRPSIVYPDPFAHGSKDVGRHVEGGATTSVVYPDPTYDVEDADMSREKPSEEDAGRNTEVDDGFSFVEKPTENTDWVEVIENEGFNMSEGGSKEGEGAAMESLLQALESMGFEDRNVNISVLQYCNFVLQDAVNDLVAAAGWDGALKDLEEMGFNERDMNIRLLVKNKGSLKQTVRELVKLEKAVMEG